ncbi:MAG: DNA polymerase III subunit beta [Endozoicomonadaceae bacterium]|nr:DNA polymerase III subunit beta [Endozoicomonadaceae bacterium]
MKFSINRDALLKPLHMISGIVERKQTSSILSNVLLKIDGSTLLLTGTDSEIELIGSINILEVFQPGSTTLSARKLFEICKSLPENNEILITEEKDSVVLSSGNATFKLLTIAPEKFPSIEDEPDSLYLTIEQQTLKRLIESTSFSMSNQDIRLYLNAMLFEITCNKLQTVAIDGHRMAIANTAIDIADPDTFFQFIMPRKGVFGLSRLVTQNNNNQITLTLNKKHIRAKTDDFIFTSALIDCRFPVYDRAIPKNIDKIVVIEKEAFRNALNRVAILSYEKNKKVLLLIEKDKITLTSKNPENEKATEILPIQYGGLEIKVNFNVHYLLNVLNVITGHSVNLEFGMPDNGVIMRDDTDQSAVYVIMPINL